MKNIFKMTAVLLVIACLACALGCNGQGDKDGAKSALYAEYKGVKIELGAAADGVINALGEAQSRTEIGDCGGLGAQVKYSYPSVDVYVLESKTDGNIIDQITFRDDTVTTPEGAYIGMSEADARAAQGEPTTASDKALIYSSGKYALKLTLADGKVSEINYITNS